MVVDFGFGRQVHVDLNVIDENREVYVDCSRVRSIPELREHVERWIDALVATVGEEP